MPDPVSSGIAIGSAIAGAFGFGGGDGGLSDADFARIKRKARRQGRRQQRRRLRREGRLVSASPPADTSQAFLPGPVAVGPAVAIITVIGAIVTERIRREIEGAVDPEKVVEEQERQRTKEQVPGIFDVPEGFDTDDPLPPSPFPTREKSRVAKEGIEAAQKRSDTEDRLGQEAARNRAGVEELSERVLEQREIIIEQQQEIQSIKKGIEERAQRDAERRQQQQKQRQSQPQPQVIIVQPAPAPAPPRPRITLGQIIQATGRIVDLVARSQRSRQPGTPTRSGRLRTRPRTRAPLVPSALAPSTAPITQTSQRTRDELCEKRRRKNRKVCWEGFYREFSSRTQFVKWTKVDCITRRIIEER